MPQLTSLEIPIPWNIRPDANGNYDVNEGIIFITSPAQTRVSLFNRIETTLSVRPPSSYNKFCLTLISLFGIRNPPEVLPYKNLQVCCREVSKLRLFIEFLYEIYANLLSGTNQTLPEIPGFAGPNFDRTVIAHLRDSDYMNTEDTILYSYAIFAYLYWAVINGYGPQESGTILLNNRHIKQRISDIENGTYIVPSEQRENTVAPPTSPITVSTRRQREQVTRARMLTVDLKFLKEKFLISYQKVIDAGINKPEDCAICLDSVNYNKDSPNDIIVLDCGHLFHSACLVKWHKKICPTCRKPHYIRTSTSRSTVLPIREVVDLRSPPPVTGRTNENNDGVTNGRVSRREQLPEPTENTAIQIRNRRVSRQVEMGIRSIFQPTPYALGD